MYDVCDHRVYIYIGRAPYICSLIYISGVCLKVKALSHVINQPVKSQTLLRLIDQ